MYIHIWILSLYLCAMFPLTLHLQASVVHGRRFDCEQYPHGSRPELNSTGLERRHLCLTNPKIVNGIREKEQHYNYFWNKYLYFDTNNVLFRNVTIQFSELVLLTVWHVVWSRVHLSAEQLRWPSQYPADPLRPCGTLWSVTAQNRKLCGMHVIAYYLYTLHYTLLFKSLWTVSSFFW